MIRITETFSIRESEIQERFIRSSGPGGQNVNKVATAAQLRFDVRNSPSLTADIKERLAGLAGTRDGGDGAVPGDLAYAEVPRVRYIDIAGRVRRQRSAAFALRPLPTDGLVGRHSRYRNVANSRNVGRPLVRRGGPPLSLPVLER